MMKWLLLVAVVAYASADSSEDGVGGSRIIGGRFYKKNEYPFIVGIAEVKRRKRGYASFCGGSIITPTTSITAAHCTDKVIKSRVKTVVLLGNPRSLYPVVIKVAAIQQHAGYIARIFINDISILTLASSINFNKNIGPVCLPQSGLDVTGQTVRVLGWGAEKYEGLNTLKPKKFDTTAVPINSCASTWGGKIPTWNPIQICTQSRRETACQGDSGGPVVWLDPQTNRYTLVGLVSYGFYCSVKRPSVNTRVAAFITWIQQQIALTMPSTMCIKPITGIPVAFPNRMEFPFKIWK
ncbi:hypothetical protein GE061_010071 [Apolygus lucorum]|uniref:Peptidase S1 domain-containing protein n=1 Tax=Apolygus lucorum TaxID=248454 RepID=A0A8S9Y3J0_APOLU|nr:hypothetical protein GE061_010071 [Apolygus lucorum]